MVMDGEGFYIHNLEIRKYMKEHPTYSPQFGLTFDFSKWYVGIGEDKLLGKIFECDRELAEKGAYFNGVYGIDDNKSRLPHKISRLLEIVAKFKDFDLEMDACIEISKLLDREGIEHLFNRTNTVDFRINNNLSGPEYIVEVKMPEYIFKYSYLFQIIEYKERFSPNIAMLLSIKSGKYYIVGQISRPLGMEYHISNGTVQSLILLNLCKRCFYTSCLRRRRLLGYPKEELDVDWSASGKYKSCPAYIALEAIEKTGYLETRVDWARNNVFVNIPTPTLDKHKEES